MNIDWLSSLAFEQNDAIIRLLQLEEEIKGEKDKDKKSEKEKHANEERKKLLSPNAHLSYHFLAVKDKASADSFRSTWQENGLQIDFTKDIEKWELDNFLKNNIIHPTINPSLLPQNSFVLQFTFTLEKHYISRDEQEFYIIDNPIRKDKVFGLPYVSPSSWKGSLRAALWQLGHTPEKEEIRRIFGNERNVEEHERLLAGRLYFFPTFFMQKGLEIINPHDRERRVGTMPILMESVPKGASGLFTLLYVPFNFEEKDIQKQVAADIQLISAGVKAMFTAYGFGAKTSSGHGIAKSELVEGKLILKAKGIEISKKEEAKPKPPEESFKKYLNEDGSVKEGLKGSGETGLLSNPEFHEKGKQLGGGSFKEFQKFRFWYGTHREQWQKHIQAKKAPVPQWPIWTFQNFDEMIKKAMEIESSLKTSFEGTQ